MNRWILSLVVFVLMSGCTTVKSMENMPTNKGVVRTYPVSHDEAFKLALHAIEVLDFKISVQDPNQKYIIASEGMSLMSFGERIGVYFNALSPTETEIRVLSKPKIKTHIFAPNWSDEVHRTIEARLNTLQQLNK